MAPKRIDGVLEPFFELYTFWNEEKNVSELHWDGHMLTGTNEATYALMIRLNDDVTYRQRLRQELSDLTDQAERVWRGA